MWTEPAILIILALTLLSVVATQLAASPRIRHAASVGLLALAVACVVLVRATIRARQTAATEKREHCSHVASRLEGIASGLEQDPSELAMAGARSDLQASARRWINLHLSLCVGASHEDGCEHALYEATKAPDVASLSESVRAVAESIRSGSACTGPRR